jgi:hypothetical protein
MGSRPGAPAIGRRRTHSIRRKYPTLAALRARKTNREVIRLNYKGRSRDFGRWVKTLICRGTRINAD